MELWKNTHVCWGCCLTLHWWAVSLHQEDAGQLDVRSALALQHGGQSDVRRSCSMRKCRPPGDASSSLVFKRACYPLGCTHQHKECWSQKKQMRSDYLVLSKVSTLMNNAVVVMCVGWLQESAVQDREAALLVQPAAPAGAEPQSGLYPPTDPQRPDAWPEWMESCLHRHNKSLNRTFSDSLSSEWK